MTARCRSCNAAIVWGRVMAWGATSRKSIPIDADERGEPLVFDDGGLVQVDPNITGILVRVEPGARGFRSHFATCVHADQHRRPR